MKILIVIFMLLFSKCVGANLLVRAPQINSVWNGHYQELTGEGRTILQVGTQQLRFQNIEGIIEPNTYDLDTIISQDPYLQIWIRTDNEQFFPLKLIPSGNKININVSKPQNQITDFPSTFETNIPSSKFF